jgi:integrase
MGFRSPRSAARQAAFEPPSILAACRPLENKHGHRWRHNFAHEWLKAGGSTGNLMLLLGGASGDMPRRCGAGAAAERAQELRIRMGISKNV